MALATVCQVLTSILGRESISQLITRQNIAKVVLITGKADLGSAALEQMEEDNIEFNPRMASDKVSFPLVSMLASFLGLYTVQPSGYGSITGRDEDTRVSYVGVSFGKIQ